MELQELRPITVTSRRLGESFRALGEAIEVSRDVLVSAAEVQDRVTHSETANERQREINAHIQAMGAIFTPEGQNLLRNFNDSFRMVQNDLNADTNRLRAYARTLTDIRDKTNVLLGIELNAADPPDLVNAAAEPSHLAKHWAEYSYVFCCLVHMLILCLCIPLGNFDNALNTWMFVIWMGAGALGLVIVGYVFKKLNLLMGVFIALDIFCFCTSVHYTEKKAAKVRKRDENAMLNGFIEPPTVLMIFIILLLTVGGSCVYLFIKKKRQQPNILPS